jgi:hypothetical protein
MRKIATNRKGVYVFCDARDYKFLSSFRWWVKDSGRKLKLQYACTTFVDGKKHRLHRLLLSPKLSQKIDHVNGNGLDNRRINLRICTQQQNAANMRCRKNKSSSKFKGVFFRKDLRTRPWVAMIGSKSKNKNLGYFATEYEAAKAYNNAALKRNGAFARINHVKL